MKFNGYNVVYTADDEEPDCGICDNQCYSDCCENCGAEYWWRYYEREEEDPEVNKFYRALKKYRGG